MTYNFLDGLVIETNTFNTLVATTVSQTVVTCPKDKNLFQVHQSFVHGRVGHIVYQIAGLDKAVEA